jgi:uncharacterized protein (TIGR03067 family)
MRRSIVGPLLPDAEVVKGEAARRDRDKLQGAWLFVSGRREAQLLVAGDHFTIRFKNGDIYVGTFQLDPTRHPRAMDMQIHEGPDRFKGKTALAIYEFDGDHLIWCPAVPGRLERLRAFPPEEDTGHLCIIFRRDRPRR